MDPQRVMMCQLAFTAKTFWTWKKQTEFYEQRYYATDIKEPISVSEAQTNEK